MGGQGAHQYSRDTSHVLSGGGDSVSFPYSNYVEIAMTEWKSICLEIGSLE